MRSYKALAHALARYWRAYGGGRDLAASPLFHLSVVVTALSYNQWIKPNWTDTAISLLPNLLGFSLGSYAIIFSLVSPTVMSALAASQTTSGGSRLEEINSTFVHFVMVQAVGLVMVLLNRATGLTDLIAISALTRPVKQASINAISAVGGCLGYWLLVYSVVLLVSAVLAVFRLALISGSAARSSNGQT